MFKTETFNGVDYKRFVRYFYDPPPTFDDTLGTSIWLLGREYKSPTAQHITTTDREDVVEVESSADSHDPSEAATASTAENADSQRKPELRKDSMDDMHRVQKSDLPTISHDPADGGWPLAFVDDFESRIWMTYRNHFPPIPRSQDPQASTSMTFAVRLRNLTEKEGFTSDTGWGCMIRSGQSLLANALLVLHLGREWRYRQTNPPVSSHPLAHSQSHSGSNPESPHLATEAQILQLFADHPDALFGIHRFVAHGAEFCGKHPGQWFGPSATASCIAALSTKCAAAGLKVYVTPSTSDIYEDRFRRIAAASPTDSTITPTLILMGLRLGPEHITPVYYEALKQSLTYPQSIGIAGGRPSSSHYFLGVQDDTFFYLDPHETRPALPYHSSPENYTIEDIATCHTRRLRGVKISEMDPSMLIGFLIRDEADWQDWKRRVSQVRGNKIIMVSENEPPLPGEPKEREEAVDEVVAFDDEETEDE